MSGADTSQDTSGGGVISDSAGANGRHQVEGVHAFCREILPNLYCDVFAGTAAFQLLLIVGRDGGEGDAVGAEYLNAVEDRYGQRLSGRAFVD